MFITLGFVFSVHTCFSFDEKKGFLCGFVSRMTGIYVIRSEKE